MKDYPTLVVVVAAALIRDDGGVLMQCRGPSRMHAGLWEFPGGKVDDGESPESALVRELREELGIVVDAADCAPLSFASDPALPPKPREPYVVLLYTCRKWLRKPRCLDGEAIAWFRPADMASLAMPPLDIPLARALLQQI